MGCAMVWLAVAGSPTDARASSGKPTPVMTTAGAALATDSFAAALPKPWNAGKGTWTVEGGVVTGLELAADKHQAVVRRPLAFKDAIISFSFRLDGARQISLSINDAKGHLCRLIVDPRGFTLRKDDNDKDKGADKPITFSRVAMTLAPNEWHHAVVELQGSEVVAQVDGATKIAIGENPMLDRAKTNFGFTVAGGPAQFRDISIVAAKPREDWGATKAKLKANAK
jgi:hypothetical protein